MSLIGLIFSFTLHHTFHIITNVNVNDNIMKSTKVSEISLPRPIVTSPDYEEEVETLVDIFDLAMQSIMEMTARTCNQSLEELEAELDELEIDDDYDDESDDEIDPSDDDYNNNGELENNDIESSVGQSPFEEDSEIMDLIFQMQNLQLDQESIDEELPGGDPSLERGRKRTRCHEGTSRRSGRSGPWRGGRASGRD